MIAVIMAGGVGERFWPLSRRRHPKQLLDLTGKGSMIHLTVDRLSGLCAPEEIYIITNVEQRDAILAAVDGRVPADNVIGEPMGRNTAPCIGLGAILARRAHGNIPMVVLPADHLIEPVEEFQRLVRAGADFVSAHGSLLTFGVEPTRPETGYGYIRAGKELEGGIFRAEAFLEKPSAEKAREFVDSGGYYWNSGMFIWTVDAILSEISSHLPELDAILKQIDRDMGTRPLPEVLKSLYGQAPTVSIDYGVMEKAQGVVVLRARFNWNDVGSWEFIRDAYPADSRDNVCVGDHVVIDASSNTIVSKDRTVGIVGLDDVVVVDGGDTILVCKRDRVQDVKKIVTTLKESGRDNLV